MPQGARENAGVTLPGRRRSARRSGVLIRAAMLAAALDVSQTAASASSGSPTPHNSIDRFAGGESFASTGVITAFANGELSAAEIPNFQGAEQNPWKPARPRDRAGEIVSAILQTLPGGPVILPGVELALAQAPGARSLLGELKGEPVARRETGAGPATRPDRHAAARVGHAGLDNGAAVLAMQTMARLQSFFRHMVPTELASIQSGSASDSRNAGTGPTRIHRLAGPTHGSVAYGASQGAGPTPADILRSLRSEVSWRTDFDPASARTGALVGGFVHAASIAGSPRFPAPAFSVAGGGEASSQGGSMQVATSLNDILPWGPADGTAAWVRLVDTAAGPPSGGGQTQGSPGGQGSGSGGGGPRVPVPPQIHSYPPPINIPHGPLNPVLAVPEPGAWSLMLVGFGALGAALRSRRKADAKLSHSRAEKPATSTKA
jgi:PEP-CTERM motif